MHFEYIYIYIYFMYIYFIDLFTCILTSYLKWNFQRLIQET